MAAQQPPHQRRRRTFCERRDVLRDYNDSQLIQGFRLDHAGILHVTDLVRDALYIGSRTARSKALFPRDEGGHKLKGIIFTRRGQSQTELILTFLLQFLAQ